MKKILILMLLTISTVFTQINAFDITLFTFDNITFDVGNQQTNPVGIDFSQNGDYFYMIGFTPDTIFRYDLSTPYDLSTASYNNNSLDITAQTGGFGGVHISNDGSRIFIMDIDDSQVHQYNLSTPYDLSSGSFDSSLNVVGTNNRDLHFDNNGFNLYIISDGNNNIYQYSLSTAFDISSATFDKTSNLSLNAPQDLRFNSDGSKVYILDGPLREYNTSSNYDIDNLTFVNILNFSTENPASFAFSKDNFGKLYTMTRGDNLVRQFSREVINYPVDINLTTNTIYNDFIYTDDEGTVITQDLSTSIIENESFSVTSNVTNTGSYTFNYWYDLDNMEVFTTNRTFTINEPDRNEYNLIADYTLNDFITFNIDSNLPTPPDFDLNTFTLEGEPLTISQYPFSNYQHPDDRAWEIVAPTTNIGFYEFDYWYDNDNNEVYNLNPSITGVGIDIPNLTATYSLPEEYQINLTLTSDVGDITFQLGQQDPITGSFISVTIGENDSWTATAPNDTLDFGFIQWNDLDNNQLFSTNRSFGISNTTRNYNLQAKFDPFYNVYWNTLGGTPIDSLTVLSGTSINVPSPDPVRPNSFFNGWQDTLGNSVSFPQIVTQDVTYQAIWLDTFQLDFDTNGGQYIQSQNVIENNTPTAVTPSRFGYTFEGWFTDDVTFQNDFDFNDPINQDTTIHAKWAFGSDRDAELSLNTFLDDSDLDDGFSQIIVMVTIFIFVNIIIFIYQAPLIVSLILNFMVAGLFMILGWIPLWIVIIIFMALFGFIFLASRNSGGS